MLASEGTAAMAERILVINPNSNRGVTRAMSEAVEVFRFPGGPAIDCIDIAAGPPGIESQADADAVAPLVRDAVAGQAADAYVVACFSDPGLYAAREVTTAPVLGIAQCGMHAAMGLGATFGIISILRRSIPRHRRYVAALHLTPRLANDRAIELTVAELAQGPVVLERMAAVGRMLVEEDGAEAIVMGCAGMAAYRAALQVRVGVPVIDPTQAAVADALRLLLTARAGAESGRRRSA
jgi:Asp/Glu/hydantoin racemase